MGVTEFKLLSLVVVVEKWRNSISAVLKLFIQTHTQNKSKHKSVRCQIFALAEIRLPPPNQQL